MFKSKLVLLAWSIIFLTENTKAVWEYQGFVGRNNNIEVSGSEPILKQPYPASWNGIGKELDSFRLCSKETEKELSDLILKYLGSLKYKISSGFKHSFAFKNSESVAIEIVGLYFEDTKNLNAAFEQLKNNNPGSSFAFIKTNTSIYLVKKDIQVPSRAFLHFVRGYDDTLADKKEMCQATATCNLSKLQVSKLIVKLEDKQFLEKIMGFSYGLGVKRFIPSLKSIESNVYYLDTRANDQVVSLTTKYASRVEANEAFEHLSKKWSTSKNHKVSLVGETVTWYGSSKLSEDCFKTFTAQKDNAITTR